MLFKELLAIAVRRWVLLVACLIVSAVALVGATFVIPADYELKSSVVLIPPKDPEQPNQNRYLGMGSLKQTADVLVNALMSEESAEDVRAKAPGAEYLVEPDWATSAPSIVITAMAATPADTEAMLAAVMDLLPRTLTALQKDVGISPKTRITHLVVATGLDPKPIQSTRIRTLAMIAVALLVLTAMLVSSVDGLLRRRSMREEKADEGSGGQPPRLEPEPDHGGRVVDLNGSPEQRWRARQ
ncbi:hypothetical protein [Nocardioides albus]|uniref:Polysaccharide chain length determinant N-terminal domain-containing protein n=1 Tax=Nocardioides albus TaxID=1841 RepID=A0A7W5A0E4_9ACTN|nr:hypothetical protein [Nocardioides albus]MBB3087155.1 hypothetical protein [Nocardioides albus]GGU07026.1 hypothetical protein GCM10007979_00760 [Nocardioides albus]